MEPDFTFAFATCQVGAEPALKAEVHAKWPGSRFAFSRPGFITFKAPGAPTATNPPIDCVFARTFAWSLGQVKGEELSDRANAAWQLTNQQPFDQIHAWPRDNAATGHRGYEPQVSEAAMEAATILWHSAYPAISRSEPHSALDMRARRGERVLDCVLIDESQWWIGHHLAEGWLTQWPGGLWPGELPSDAVSRAYLKVEEALAWSGLPVRSGQRCAEIGCAPGGSSQALLNRGLEVMGVDPALVHPSVSEHPNFVHVRKRGADVRRRDFRKVDWLLCDMNLAPSYALDTVEAIVTHPEVRVRGLLLTLKLLNWELAADVPQYLARIASWGFDQVRAKQLPRHHREFCVAARRKKVHR